MEFTSDQIIYLRDEIVRYAEFWLTKPYFWAGDDFEGLDCSGGCIEWGKRVGLFSHSYDGTAHDIYMKFKNCDLRPNTTLKGCFIFWGNLGKMRHIELMVDNFSSIGASGGGSPKFDVYDIIMADPFLFQYFAKGLDPLDVKKTIADDDSIILKMAKRELLRLQASTQNAYVKIRATDGREPFFILDPFLSLPIKTI